MLETKWTSQITQHQSKYGKNKNTLQYPNAYDLMLHPLLHIHFSSRIHKDLRRTVDLCQKAQSAGVSWITVHGRTSEERHQPVHYDAIKTIKDSVSIPVIANGDIKYLRDVESTYQLTGVDGILISY